MTGQRLDIVQLTRPGDAGPAVRRQLTDCWIAVTNAGGAAGFPFPPVDAGHVAPAVDNLTAGLHPERGRLLLARSDGALAGWVLLRRDPSPLIGHWGTVHHLQSQPARRGEGIGTALMEHLRRVARDEMGLEQLHLAAPGWRRAGGLLRPAGLARDRALARQAPARSRRHPRRDPDDPGAAVTIRSRADECR